MSVMDHDGDQMDWDDSIFESIRIHEARERGRLGLTAPQGRCVIDTCRVGLLPGEDTWCRRHDAQAAAQMAQSWPPVIE